VGVLSPIIPNYPHLASRSASPKGRILWGSSSLGGGCSSRFIGIGGGKQFQQSPIPQLALRTASRTPIYRGEGKDFLGKFTLYRV